MRRNRAIATTAALAGVLVAGTVAAVAIVNATDADPVASQVTLLADVSPAPDAPALPSVGTGELPAVQLPSSAPSAPAPAAPGGAVGTVSQPEPAPAVGTALTAGAARSAVLDQAPGTVLAVRSTVRQGYDAFAVKVERKDGSVVTGYVDKSSGVVFDWREVSGPTPSQDQQASSNRPGDDDATESESESNDNEHESEGTEVEHESDGDDD